MNAFHYAGQRVLILAPHADDETIGCGGIIQKYVQGGSPVRIMIASFVMSAYKKFNKDQNEYQIYQGERRFQELQNAFQVLGVSDYHILYVDESDDIRYHSKLDTIPRIELVGAIEQHIQEFQPTILFIPSKTKHQDHDALHMAGLTAARPYFWNGSVIVYETDGEFDFQPNLYVSLAEEEVKKKARALRAYRTQVGSKLHPVNPAVIINKAKYRGQMIYNEFAEAFQIIRMQG